MLGQRGSSKNVSSIKMDWFFDGLGTLLIGLLVGGVGGGAICWKIAVNRTVQRQHSGDKSSQVQAGRDVVRRKR